MSKLTFCIIVLVSAAAVDAVTFPVCLLFGDLTSTNFGVCGPDDPYANSVCSGSPDDIMIFQFTDSSGFASVSSVDYQWHSQIDCAPNAGTPTSHDLHFNAVTVGTYVHDTVPENCNCGAGAASVDTVVGTVPPANYVLGGLNDFRTDTFVAADSCQGVSTVVDGCLVSLVVTGSFSGGGGDPHLWGPALGQPRFDLGAFGRARTLEYSDMDVILAEADGVELRGHVRSKPGSDRQYFTELSLVSGEETIVVSSVVDKADAWMAVRQDEHVTSCLSTDDAVRLDISSASAVTNCGTALQRATTNPFMKTHFPSHIEHVVSAVTLEASSFVVEVFYVQKGRAGDGTWDEAPFGFFDFHIRPGHPSASFDGLLGTIVPDRERSAASPEEKLHYFNEHILRHVSFV